MGCRVCVLHGWGCESSEAPYICLYNYPYEPKAQRQRMLPKQEDTALAAGGKNEQPKVRLGWEEDERPKGTTELRCAQMRSIQHPRPTGWVPFHGPQHTGVMLKTLILANA